MGIFSFWKRGNTLYYPGCLSKYVLKAEAENYKRILTNIGIDYIMLPNELCCGSPVLNAGYEKEAIKLARKNFDLFKEHNIKRIITNCPACFKMFAKDYKELLSDWNIEVEHTSSVILKYLRKKGIENPSVEKVAYHDPCHLGRHMNFLRNQEISEGHKNLHFSGYDEPRELLRRLGYEVVELPNSKENSLCCGGGAGLKSNNPELANKIAKIRVEQALRLDIKKIITTCPLCFANLQENSSILVEEFSHVVAKALGIEHLRTEIKELK